MRLRWVATCIFVLSIAVSAVYGSWLYVRSVAREAFENDILKVKQSFYEGVKAADSAVQSLKSFSEAVEDGDQTRFGRFSQELMSKLPFVVTASYYRHVDAQGRAAYEALLKSRGAGETILESGSETDAPVRPASRRSEYFAIDAVDNAAKENSYFGWDVLSDASKVSALRKAISEKQPRATGTFLLDSGNVAFEIFAPVFGPGEKLRGVIGATVDLTKMLGEQQWRDGVTVIMTTVLSSELAPKDIYRSIDREPVRWIELAALTTSLEVDRFGQMLGLKFEKVLFPGRVNLSIVGIAAIAAVLLSILAFYLLITYDHLQVTLSNLADANATLEQKVLLRTRDLAIAHSEIKEILDNLDEVVFAVSPDGAIGPVYSPASKRLLGMEDFNGLDLTQVLFKDLDRHDEEVSRHLFTLDMLSTYDEFQWTLSCDDLLKVSQFQIDGGARRTFSLRYSPVFESDVIRKLIVVASDVTEIISLKESLAAREKEASTRDAVLGELASSNKAQVGGFFAETDERITEVAAFVKSPRLGDALLVLRTLHTMKGSSRSIGLKALAKQVHEVEDGLESLGQLVATKRTSADIDLNFAVEGSGLLEICQTYGEYRRVFRDLFEAGVRSSTPQLAGRILPFLRSERNGRIDLVRWYEEASQSHISSVSEMVQGFSKSIGELAEELQKDVALEIPKWDLYVDSSLKSALNEAFTHALRNAVDHGIESKEKRASLKKPVVGRIWLEREVTADGVTLVVADDGGGVDLKRVHSIASEKGLITKSLAEMNAAEILDLLFLPGFSTKSEVSDVSGRGIGLDAVRSSLDKLGVTCKIDATTGQGSRFAFLIPRSKLRFTSTEDAELSAVA